MVSVTLTATAFSDGRWMAPLFTLALLLIFVICDLFQKTLPAVRAKGVSSDGKAHALYAETLIGSEKSCDLVLPGTEKRHGVLIIREDGLVRAESLDGSLQAGKKRKGGAYTELKEGDRIRAGKVSLSFQPEETRLHPSRVPSLIAASVMTLYACFLADRTYSSAMTQDRWQIIPAFIFLVLGLWGNVLFSFFRRRTPSATVFIAAMLAALSLVVTSAYLPSSVLIQGICVLIGMVLFQFFLFLLEIDRLRSTLRWVALGMGVVLLLLNLLHARALLGARNWLTLGGISVQPSELVKTALLALGACSAWDRARKLDLARFILFVFLCIAALAWMRDFGTASVFFFAFLVMLWVRSGAGSAGLAVAFAAASGGLLLLLFHDGLHYAFERVLNWGTAWENVLDSGYQQSRAMMAAASGGLCGVGIGSGWLGSVFAAGSDMPFALLWEEVGLIGAFTAVLAVGVIDLAAIRSAIRCGSSFFMIPACGAAAILTAQTILNVCGTMDMLPFTGVTFPFLSSGGTSMIACWMILAFIAAGEERCKPMLPGKEKQK